MTFQYASEKRSLSRPNALGQKKGLDEEVSDNELRFAQV